MKFTLHPDKTVIADDIAQITFGELVPVQGGSHNAMLLAGNQHITIQLPQCKTKSGLVRTSKKQYCDLEFELEAHGLVTDWMESLEEHCIDMLNEKRGEWFGSGTTVEDIEDSMASNVKVNRDGKTFVIRVDIGGGSGMKIQYGEPCAVYDVTGNPRTLEDIQPGSTVIPLIVLRHVKIANTFNISIQMTQLMLVEERVCVVENLGIDTRVVEGSVEGSVDGAVEESVDTPPQFGEGYDVGEVKLDTIVDVVADNTIGNAKDPLDIAQVVNLDVADITETTPLQLMEAKDVRIKMYKEAKRRAITARKRAIEEIMRARDIKMEFMLDDYVDSDSEVDSDMDSVYGGEEEVV